MGSRSSYRAAETNQPQRAGDMPGTSAIQGNAVAAHTSLDANTRPVAARRSWEFSARKPPTDRGFPDSLPVARRLAHGRVVSIVERQATHPFDRPKLHFALTETGSGQMASKSFKFDFLWDPQCRGGPGQPAAGHLGGWHAHRLSVGEDRQLSESDHHEARRRTAPSRKNPSEPGGSRSTRPLCAQAGSSALHLQEDGALEARVAMD